MKIWEFETQKKNFKSLTINKKFYSSEEHEES